MADDKKNPRYFEVEEYTKKVKLSLNQLKKDQKPGEKHGKGTRLDILKLVRENILELHNLGYSIPQITEAISKNVFKVYPSMIKEILLNEEIKKKSQKASKSDKKPPVDEITDLPG